MTTFIVSLFTFALWKVIAVLALLLLFVGVPALLLMGVCVHFQIQVDEKKKDIAWKLDSMKRHYGGSNPLSSYQLEGKARLQVDIDSQKAAIKKLWQKAALWNIIPAFAALTFICWHLDDSYKVIPEETWRAWSVRNLTQGWDSYQEELKFDRNSKVRRENVGFGVESFKILEITSPKHVYATLQDSNGEVFKVYVAKHCDIRRVNLGDNYNLHFKKYTLSNRPGEVFREFDSLYAELC